MGPEQTAGRRTEVFLDVFTYYMFWNAFYVLRDNRCVVRLRCGKAGSWASLPFAKADMACGAERWPLCWLSIGDAH